MDIAPDAAEASTFKLPVNSLAEVFHSQNPPELLVITVTLIPVWAYWLNLTVGCTGRSNSSNETLFAFVFAQLTTGAIEWCALATRSPQV